MAPSDYDGGPHAIVRCARLSRRPLQGAVRPEHAVRSHGARTLLRALLEQTTGISGTLWQLEPGPNGKLLAFGPERWLGPEVSLSHSRDWVAAAVSRRGPIGVDVECVRPKREIVKIADIAFGPNERALVARQGDAAFYRIWTLREAMAKASGVGLTEVTDRCDRVAIVGLGNGAWTGHAAGNEWLLLHREPATAVHLAVALAVSEKTVKIAIPHWRESPQAYFAYGLDIDQSLDLELGVASDYDPGSRSSADRI